jgi:hypothetical protein
MPTSRIEEQEQVLRLHEVLEVDVWHEMNVPEFASSPTLFDCLLNQSAYIRTVLLRYARTRRFQDGRPLGRRLLGPAFPNLLLVSLNQKKELFPFLEDATDMVDCSCETCIFTENLRNGRVRVESLAIGKESRRTGETRDFRHGDEGRTIATSRVKGPSGEREEAEV